MTTQSSYALMKELNTDRKTYIDRYLSIWHFVCNFIERMEEHGYDMVGLVMTEGRITTWEIGSKPTPDIIKLCNSEQSRVFNILLTFIDEIEMEAGRAMTKLMRLNREFVNSGERYVVLYTHLHALLTDNLETLEKVSDTLTDMHKEYKNIKQS